MSKIERRVFVEYGLPWPAIFRKHFWRGILWGFAMSLLMIVRVLGAASFEGHGAEKESFPQIDLPVARLR